jgi:RNA polymerase II C-terminal domain phosphatase-like 3/4
VRKEVLQGCRLVFSRLFPRDAHRPQDHYFWKMAERLGAVCRTDVDSMVTHVVAMDRGTDKALWATINNKFLVHPRWLEAANFRWCRQPEEDFPVPHSKKKVKENAMASHHEETSKDKGNVVAGEKEMAQDKDTVAAGGEETTTAGPAESQAMQGSQSQGA